MATLPALKGIVPRRPLKRPPFEFSRRLRSLWHRGRRQPPRLNPILARLAVAALVVVVLGTWHFHAVFGGAWLDAVYFVVTTMTTTGYGDLTPDRSNPVDVIAAMLLMLSGAILTGLFIAFGASLLTRVHWVALQGLRPVHHRGHIIVCGAGNIGTNVIELLLALGKRLVVIETSPDTAIVEQAREQRFDLLTGDASRDATLDLCNLGAAARPRGAHQCRHLEPGDRTRRPRQEPDDADRAADRRRKFRRLDRPAFRVRDDFLG